MKKAPKISDAEWRIMKVLWDAPGGTVNDVADALHKETRWHPKTVRTMMNRLVTKGVLKSVKDQGPYRYTPALSREDCVDTAADSFLDRLFDGALVPMVSHFVRHRKLSAKERAALKKILEEDR